MAGQNDVSALEEQMVDNSVKKSERKPNLWNRLSGPVKVGLAFALIAIVMALIGLLKGAVTTPLSVRSILMALVISGGTWGVVSWAIATAVVEVEQDVAAVETPTPQAGTEDDC